MTNIDDKYNNKWIKTSTFSSHVEGNICAIQGEEIFTGIKTGDKEYGQS